MVVLAATMAIGVGSAAAFEGGGRAPSSAPLVAYGQHYTASLDNRKEDANSVGRATVAFWKLPPLTTHDQIVVNWQELPFAHNSDFPICMTLAQGITDFNWGSVLESSGGSYGYCDGNGLYEVSASGTAATSFTVQNSDANSYLEFFAPAETTESQKFETYPYNFTVEAPRHYLTVSLGAVQRVAANGALHATATLATGAPAPNGLAFTLTASWSGGGVFTATAASVGGQLTFPLALPETAYKQDVEFVVASAATAEWQAATSPKLYIEVTKPKVAPPAVEPQLCTKATTRAQVLARQFHRQLRQADAARGRRRRRLFREARATGRRFDAAKAARKAAC
jgi:hypothetical protein